MPRSFSMSDAKRLLRLQKDIDAKLRQIESVDDRLRAEITSAAEKMAGSGSMEILDTIPVEELNRDKKGIRVKMLRDSGFSTLADIVKASEYSLSSINGISPDGAKAIKQAASEIAEKAKSGTKIRLSTDDKNPLSTALISSLCKYKRAVPFIKKADEYLTDFGSSVSAAAADLRPAAGSLKWLFASSQKRSAAESAYQALSSILTDDLYKEISSAARAVQSSQATASAISIFLSRLYLTWSEAAMRFTDCLRSLRNQ